MHSVDDDPMPPKCHEGFQGRKYWRRRNRYVNLPVWVNLSVKNEVFDPPYKADRAMEAEESLMIHIFYECSITVNDDCV